MLLTQKASSWHLTLLTHPSPTYRGFAVLCQDGGSDLQYIFCGKLRREEQRPFTLDLVCLSSEHCGFHPGPHKTTHLPACVCILAGIEKLGTKDITHTEAQGWHYNKGKASSRHEAGACSVIQAAQGFRVQKQAASLEICPDESCCWRKKKHADPCWFI